MHFTTLLTLLSALSLSLSHPTTHPSPQLKRRGVKPSFQFTTPVPFTSTNVLTTTSNTLSLTSKKSADGLSYNPRSAAFLLGHAVIPTANHSTGLLSLFEGEEFATPVTFGTQTFDFIVDTGSSDTWVIESGFQCVNITTSAPIPEADCDFGPTWNKDSTFKEIPGENFNITYGDGEFLTGVLGWESVTVAGLSVNQTVPVVNYAAWEGDGTTSGLLGLAYEAITSAFAGTVPSADTPATQIPYSPIFETLYKSRQIPPLFSLAILRASSGPAGYLSLGGVPPVSFTQSWTSTPILITTIDGYPKKYDFYTININSVVLNGFSVPSSGGKIQYIVDSGTTLNYYPTAIADAINAAFVPPAVYSEEDGAYLVDCKAKAPKTGVKIGGTTFDLNAADLILDAGTDGNGNEVCISGIDDGGSNTSEDVYILGDVFLKNVVAVFDVGATEFRVAAHEYYSI